MAVSVGTGDARSRCYLGGDAATVTNASIRGTDGAGADAAAGGSLGDSDPSLVERRPSVPPRALYARPSSCPGRDPVYHYDPTAGGDVLATRPDTDTRFERLVAEHSSTVWRYAHGILGDPHDAEEATQDTFVRVHRSLDRFRGDASERTWIVAICRNVCIDRLRRLRPEHDSLEELGAVGVEVVDPYPDLAEGAAVRRTLTAGLAELSEDERDAFVLVDVLGMSGTEAAEVAGVRPTTLRSRLHRAHTKLVDHLLRGDAR